MGLKTLFMLTIFLHNCTKLARPCCLKDKLSAGRGLNDEYFETNVRPVIPEADRLLTEGTEADCDTIYSNSFLKCKLHFITGV